VHIQAAPPLAVLRLPTVNSVLLSGLEWGEVLVVKDSVTYFGRHAGVNGAVRDLFLPDRPMASGTLVLLPLLYRCRPLGCIYLLAPWDVHASLGKAALQEVTAALSAGIFRALLSGGRVQAEWYADVLAEEGGSTSLSSPSPPLAPPGVVAAAAAAAARAAHNLMEPADGAAKVTQLVCQSNTQPPLLPASTQQGHQLTHRPPRCSNLEEGTTTGTTSANTVAAGTGALPSPVAAPPPAGLMACGHASVVQQDLALWPELLDVREELARSRHTVVYRVDVGGSQLAVKLYRHQQAGEMGGVYSGSGSGSAGGGGSSSAAVREAELEGVLGLQYALCGLYAHEHILAHVAVFPHIFEVRGFLTDDGKMGRVFMIR
jgi:hypothetical protein